MSIADECRDAVTRSVVTEFLARFAPCGRVLWLAEGSEAQVHASKDRFAQFCRYLAAKLRLPTVGIADVNHHRLFLVDVARLGSQLTIQRRDTLAEVFRGCGRDLIFVTAFESRYEFQHLVLDSPWGTAAWLADEPDHMIHFNGDKFLGPYPPR